MMNKISIHSQQKGNFAGTHPTVPNYNNTTKLFPILKPTKHRSHQTQFLSNLEHIKFSGDDILQLETTWNVIGTAFSNTFGTFRTLPKYRDLLHSDKTTIYDFLFPPKNSPFFPQAEATYFQLADALHTHLSKDKTISVEQAPQTHMIFNLKKHNPDGFLILKHIIFELSPHLGGKGPDAQDRVDSFHISSEATLYEFQSRSIQLFDTLNIIKAIPDTTTQINKFIGKYITQLQSQPDLNIKSVMSKHILHWNQFQK
jgi:hypothetical protein